MPSSLALDGGSPIRFAPMPGWPAPSACEQTAVAEVLASGHLNYWTGEQGRLLEREYADALGRKHGIAVANGTLALELALRAFGVGPGDEVIVPARTFIATASSVVAVGATPVVADIERESGNLSPEAARSAITPRTRAIIPVHVGGWPADMDALSRLAEEHGLIIIEDCAQANGATLRGRQVGNLGSHAATFSFCQDKIIPAGEGGLLVLDDPEAYERAWSYKDHGKSRVKLMEPAAASNAFRWVHDSFGSNWRLSEVSSALVRCGLAALPAWHAARARHARALIEGLADVAALRIPVPAQEIEHGFYRLYAYVVPERLSPDWDRDRITQAVSAEGVRCQYGTCAEIYREGAFAALHPSPTKRLSTAAELHETQLALFVHPTLAEADVEDTIMAVRKVMAVASA